MPGLNLCLNWLTGCIQIFNNGIINLMMELYTFLHFYKKVRRINNVTMMRKFPYPNSFSVWLLGNIPYLFIYLFISGGILEYAEKWRQLSATLSDLKTKKKAPWCECNFKGWHIYRTINNNQYTECFWFRSLEQTVDYVDTELVTVFIPAQ